MMQKQLFTFLKCQPRDITYDVPCDDGCDDDEGVRLLLLSLHLNDISCIAQIFENS